MNRRAVIACAIAIALLAAALFWRFPGNHPATPPAAVPALAAFVAPPASRDPGIGLRPALRDAIGFQPDLSWEQRIHLIRQLPADLGEAETAALLAALMERRPPGVSTALHSSYFHEIASRLQDQPTVRETFARALATLVRDTRRDATTRDYAIQHLRQIWDHASDTPAIQTAIVTTFREFASLDPAIATSALLSLHLLSTARLAPITGVPATPSAPPPGFALPDADLAPLLIPIFAQATAADNIPARLTANRIAAERRLADFRQPLLAQLTNPAEHALVRMAAANALGRIANPDDLATLAAYTPDDDRVATAVAHALRSRRPPPPEH